MSRNHSKYSLLVGLTLILGSCQIDDTSSPDPGETFIKYYGDSGAQSGTGMLYLEGADELIIYGTRRGLADGDNEDLFLLRVDMDGNEIQSRSLDFGPDESSSFSGGGAGGDTPGSLTYYPDLGFVYVGTSTRSDTANNTGNFNALVWAIIDENFDVANDSTSVGEIIIETQEEVNGTITTAQFFDVSGAHGVIVDDTILQVVGSSNFQQPGDLTTSLDDDETQIYTARIGLNSRQVLRERTFGFTGNDEGIFIDQFRSNDLVIIATTERQTAEGTNIYVLPITNNGIELEGTVVSFPISGSLEYSETVSDVFKRPNGYIVTGTSTRGGESHPYFANINYSGNGSTTIDQADTVNVIFDAAGTLDGTGLGVDLATNGNYFIVGSLPRFAGKGDEIMVLQADQFGRFVSGSARNYGLESGNDRANDVLALADGSLLVLTTIDFGNGNTLLGLMKINQNGDLMD